MSSESPVYEVLSADSFLEWAFLRWVLHPATLPSVAERVQPQADFSAGDRSYRLDYEVLGDERRIVVELDGFSFTAHVARSATTACDKMISPLQTASWSGSRTTRSAAKRHGASSNSSSFSSSTLLSVRTSFRIQPSNQAEVVPDPVAERHLDGNSVSETYFDQARRKINRRTLRLCQDEAFSALTNYYLGGGRHAATVMSVGAGKTALGILASPYLQPAARPRSHTR